MFTLIENKDEVSLAQDNLLNVIKKNFTKRYIHNIGHPGGILLDQKIYTDGTYWFSSGDLIKNTPSPRKLNLFGLYENKKSLRISVEVNTPYQGINNKISGFFSKNSENGKIYLSHTGGIGGGKKGVGKDPFLTWLDDQSSDWSNEQSTEIIDSKGKSRDGILLLHVNKIESTRLMERYIDYVVEFKK